MPTEQETYEARPGVNWSRLKLLDEQAGGCPADYRDARLWPIDTDTHSRRGLRLVHTLVLEPQHFGRDYFVPQAHPATVASVRRKIDEGRLDVLSTLVRARLLDEPAPEYVACDARKNSRAWKAIEAACPGAVLVKSKDLTEARTQAPRVAFDVERADAGVTPVTDKQLNAASDAAAAVRAHPVAGPIVTSPTAEFEQFLEYVDAPTGLLCKGRADIIDHSSRMVWDLKSMQSAAPRDVEREIARMRYHGQGAHYTADNGYGFGIIAVAKCRNSDSYRVSVVVLGEAWMSIGRALRDRLMSRLAECEQTDTWPDHTPDSALLVDNPPSWAQANEFADDGIDFDHEVPHV